MQSFMPREARAAWRLKARPTIAAGSGMDDSSGSRTTFAKGALHALGFTGETLEAAGLRE
jgi:hypothetical protein